MSWISRLAYNWPASISKAVVRGANWLGDAVMCLPAVRALRAALPSAEIAMGAIMPVEKEFAMVTELSHRPDFPIRIRGYLYGVSVPEGFTAIRHDQGDDRFRMIGVKYIGDGSTQGLTAAVSKPYTFKGGVSDSLLAGRLGPWLVKEMTKHAAKSLVSSAGTAPERGGTIRPSRGWALATMGRTSVRVATPDKFAA